MSTKRKLRWKAVIVTQLAAQYSSGPYGNLCYEEANILKDLQMIRPLIVLPFRDFSPVFEIPFFKDSPLPQFPSLDFPLTCSLFLTSVTI